MYYWCILYISFINASGYLIYILSNWDIVQIYLIHDT